MTSTYCERQIPPHNNSVYCSASCRKKDNVSSMPPVLTPPLGGHVASPAASPGAALFSGRRLHTPTTSGSNVSSRSEPGWDLGTGEAGYFTSKHLPHHHQHHQHDMARQASHSSSASLSSAGTLSAIGLSTATSSSGCNTPANGLGTGATARPKLYSSSSMGSVPRVRSFGTLQGSGTLRPLPPLHAPGLSSSPRSVDLVMPQLSVRSSDGDIRACAARTSPDIQTAQPLPGSLAASNPARPHIDADNSYSTIRASVLADRAAARRHARTASQLTMSPALAPVDRSAGSTGSSTTASRDPSPLSSPGLPGQDGIQAPPLLLSDAAAPVRSKRLFNFREVQRHYGS